MLSFRPEQPALSLPKGPGAPGRAVEEPAVHAAVPQSTGRARRLRRAIVAGNERAFSEKMAAELCEIGGANV